MWEDEYVTTEAAKKNAKAAGVVRMFVRDQHPVEIARLHTHFEKAPKYLFGAHSGVDKDVGLFAGNKYGVAGRTAAEYRYFHSFP